MTTSRLRSNAFTMIESAIATGIVGVLMVVSVGAFSGIARMRGVESERRQGYLLAGHLMGEIMQCSFQTPGGAGTFGPAAGATRSTFAKVDDYNGYSASPPQFQSGSPMADYSGWTENVAVSYVDPKNLSSSLASSSLKRIVVTLTAPSGKSYSLTGARSQYGIYDATPTQKVNAVTGVSLGVRVGTVSTSRVTAHPLNMNPGS